VSEPILDYALNVVWISIAVAALICIAVSFWRPVPFIGFRVGYAYISKRCWKKINIVAGLAFLSIALSVPIQRMVMDSGTLILLLALEIVVATWILTEVAERIAERELLRIEDTSTQCDSLTELRSLKPFPILVAVALAMLVVLIIVAVQEVPRLPSTVALHFGPNGEPDRYGSREELLTSLILSTTLIYSIYALFIYLGVKKPEAFHKPWLGIEGVRKIVEALYAILTLIAVIVDFAFIDTIHYNAYGSHVASPNIMVPLTLGSIFVLVLYATIMYVRYYLKNSWRSYNAFPTPRQEP